MIKKEEADKLFQNSLDDLASHRLDAAVRGCMEAKNAFDELNDYFWCARCQNLLGVIYGALDNETMAVECYLNGLDYIKEHQINGLAHLFYNNIGTRYLELGATNSALEFFTMAHSDIIEHGKNFPGMSDLWSIVNYVNLGVAYFRLGKYEASEKYLLRAMNKAEKTGHEDYNFTIICGLSRLYLAMGSENYAREHLDTMVEYACRKFAPINDYMQDVKEFTIILKEMKEYVIWENCLKDFDELANSQKSVTIMLQAVEFWIDYYKTMGMEDERREMCIKHMDLYLEQQKSNNLDKIMALDIKLELQKVAGDIKSAKKKLEEDDVTGLNNRYAMRKHGTRKIEAAIKSNTMLAVGIMDIDHFKELNDTYGHLRGDEAIRLVGTTLENCLLEKGKVYRYGGDEFVLIIPDADENILNGIAINIFKNIASSHIPNRTAPTKGELTVSLGIFCAVPKPEDKLEDLFDRADSILYQVKKNGRNDYQIIFE